MKKIFSILAIAAAMVACSKDDATTDTATDVAPATYTLTGYSSLDTRTDFGTPNEETKKFHSFGAWTIRFLCHLRLVTSSAKG